MCDRYFKFRCDKWGRLLSNSLSRFPLQRDSDDPTNKRRKNDDNSLCYVIKILSNTRTIFSQGRMFSYFLRFTQKARFFESRNLMDGFRVDGFPFDERLQHITVLLFELYEERLHWPLVANWLRMNLMEIGSAMTITKIKKENKWKINKCLCTDALYE